MVPIGDLCFDPDNPRLPADMQGQDQEGSLVDLALGFDAYAVAESIASHGYFLSEPLIALAENDGSYIVVEGNRRLTALLGWFGGYPCPVRGRRPVDELRKETSVARASDRYPVVVAPIGGRPHPSSGSVTSPGSCSGSRIAQARYVADWWTRTR